MVLPRAVGEDDEVVVAGTESGGERGGEWVHRGADPTRRIGVVVGYVLVEPERVAANGAVRGHAVQGSADGS
ncbi:hypothetical protein GCM10023114_10720 [Mycolicibacterium sediminis]|uniref:Uncharacterized protein n=1 Tax=Mycolicibacterium sediminis TaxID=1286180 RepID=A0A7I7QRW9_9MYCO|nr:hypothetical protein MSEDJ_31600 [Mycolicibacterium sediminis]